MQTSVPNLPYPTAKSLLEKRTEILNINTIMKVGFVDRVHVQCTIIFPERGVQEKEEKKDIRY